MSKELAASLAEVERSRLAELEVVIEHGLQTFYEVGEALMEIRESRLYRETHPTFRAYCQERFGFSDSRGRQLIAAAKTVTDVTLRGLPAPRTEGEARRLARELRLSEAVERLLELAAESARYAQENYRMALDEIEKARQADPALTDEEIEAEIGVSFSELHSRIA